MEKISFVNAKFGSGFPVEDLRFGNPQDAKFKDLEDAQSKWNVLVDGKPFNELYIESSMHTAREAFHDTMEEFADADEDQRMTTVMEAMLYRRMLIWDQEKLSPEAEAEKEEFKNALNVFLHREEKKVAAVKDAEANNTEDTSVALINEMQVNGEELVVVDYEAEADITPQINYVYVPDEKALALRDLVQSNKEELTSDLRRSFASADKDVQRLYDMKYEPTFNRTAGRTMDSWRGLQPRGVFLRQDM